MVLDSHLVIASQVSDRVPEFPQLTYDIIAALAKIKRNGEEANSGNHLQIHCPPVNFPSVRAAIFLAEGGDVTNVVVVGDDGGNVVLVALPLLGVDLDGEFV